MQKRQLDPYLVEFEVVTSRIAMLQLHEAGNDH